MNPFGTTVMVLGVGARTAVGMTAPATAAAVRAGVAGFENHPFVIDTAGNKMIVAAAPYLGPAVDGADRVAELAAPAAAEALAAFAAAPGGNPSVPIFLGLPPPRPGLGKDLATVAVARVREAVAVRCRVAKVEIIETGHAAGAMAVKAAWEAVRSGTAEFALAGGADSYMKPETLEWLEANDQVHSAGPENNPYGFIPGEGAGFVLLVSAAAAEQHKLRPGVELLTAANTKETKLIKTDAVCTGEGLTALFRALAGEPPTVRADHLYCDMNGEPYRADEFGFATVRAGGLLRDPSAFTAPADCWGDVGAASGPLFLVLIDAAARKGYAPGPVLAAFNSSESGERCGFVVRVWTARGVR
jgi:3-oxoacyl-[acyl-carrier-protein] synthase-1